MQLNLPWQHHGPMPGRPTSNQTGRFPNRVRALRQAAGLTQEQLAERLSVTTSAAGKLERGERRLRNDQIAILSQVFHVHPAELLLPISPEASEALKLFAAADPAMRKRMIQMLRMLVEPMTSSTGRAA